jgi:hypothetical protein
VGKCGTAGWAADGNVIWRMLLGYTHTHTLSLSLSYIILYIHGNNGSTNAPQYYVIHTILALYNFL